MIGLIFASALVPYALVPPEQRPVFLTNAIEAVASKNANRITSLFGEIVEVKDDGSRPIAASEALRMLSQCTLKEVRSLHTDVYVVNYDCPSRRLAAKGCDSGDIALIFDQDRRSFALSNRRKLTLDCPPPAPPAPPRAQVPSNRAPFKDPKDHYRVAKQIIDLAMAGDDREVSSLIWPDSKIKFDLDRPSLSKTWNLDASNIRLLLSGCKRDGQIEVDNTGTTMSFVCSNQQLAGRYHVTFEYYGQKVMIAFISKHDDKAGDASIKAGDNG